MVKKRAFDKKSKIHRINKKTTIAEVLKSSPRARKKLESLGLFCYGCPMASFESIEDAALSHGVNPDNIIKKLSSKKKKDGKRRILHKKSA